MSSKKQKHSFSATEHIKWIISINNFVKHILHVRNIAYCIVIHIIINDIVVKFSPNYFVSNFILFYIPILSTCLVGNACKRYPFCLFYDFYLYHVLTLSVKFVSVCGLLVQASTALTSNQIKSNQRVPSALSRSAVIFLQSSLFCAILLHST